jgi:hypothetical protein
MLNKKTVIVCVLLAVACLSVGAVIGSLVTLYWVSGSGVIKLPPTIGVYAESACSTPVTQIDWGTLSPGDVAKKVVYIRNEGTYPVTLSLSTTNWNPSQAQQYLACTWDYAGQPIAMNSVIAMTFSLAVSSNLTRSSGITTFSFDVVLTVQG